MTTIVSSSTADAEIKKNRTEKTSRNNKAAFERLIQKLYRRFF